MALEGGKKPEVYHDQLSALDWIILVLRVLAFLATLSATLIMTLNKETRTVVLGMIGAVPVKATLTPKFQHTPAFVFFVMANGNASLHNLLMLALNFMGRRLDSRELAPLANAVLDLINVAIVSGGACTATFMGQQGRDANPHAQWNKICDIYKSYCDHGRGAIIASFIGLILMISITSISIIRLRNHNNKLLLNSSIVP